MQLARFGWLATVLACLIAVLILLLQGYFGYAAVTFAVAAEAEATGTRMRRRAAQAAERYGRMDAWCV